MASRWVKEKIKQILIALGIIAIASAATVITPNRSFERLANVERIPAEAVYRITYDKWSQVEIPEKDMPEAVLRKWGDETFIKISYPDFHPVRSRQDKGKLKWVNSDKEVHLYPLNIDEGGFEFEIILKKKPKTNKIVLDIETQGLRFAKQKPLHPDHPTWNIDKFGGERKRPENVVGAYVFCRAIERKIYSNQKEADKYKAGEFGIIYRPKLIDNDGWEVWGELNISDGKLIVTIPQNFIDNAKYPIRRAAGTDFGYKTKGNSTYRTANYIMFWDAYASGGAGTADSMTIAVLADGEDPIKLGIYDSSDNSRTGYTEEWTVTTGYDDWKTLNIISGGTLADASYYLVWWQSTYGDGIYYNDGLGGTAHYDSETYNSFPDPISVSDWGDNKYSIYCTYSVAAERRIFRSGEQF